MRGQEAIRPKPISANLNIEFALVTKDDRVIMAIKRLTPAPVEDHEGNRMDIVICGPASRTKHRVEIWNFILPLIQDEEDFLQCTPESVDVRAIVTACREAALWKDWKRCFAERVAADETLTKRQVDEVELILRASEGDA